jgi:threonine dehydrogenase-like Zn-dependent dehydrogenase
MGIVEEVGPEAASHVQPGDRVVIPFNISCGTADPLNMLQLFDKGVKIAMGQAHVKRWIDDVLPLVSRDDDPLGVEDLCTHRLPLEEAPHAYEIFQKKEDGAIKIILQP